MYYFQISSAFPKNKKIFEGGFKVSNTVGIICEYNPFHKGHKYQIDNVREKFPDATIVAIMSGNIVQRGEFAMMNKYDRAKIALECGVNVVFELPYPYSGSCAEIFANAGVELAYRLGCDTLCFGTEILDAKALESIAQIIDSDEFEREMQLADSDKTQSYITKKEKVLKKLGCCIPKSANDMLGVEYIRAIKNKHIPLRYVGIERVGSFYNDESVSEVMSATAVRKYFYENGEFVSVPTVAEKHYEGIKASGKYLDNDLVDRFFKSYLLLNCDGVKDAFDSNAEIESIVKNAIKNGESINSLSSKIYTTARIKRVIMYKLFGVKDVDFTPQFTVLLGADEKGLGLAKRITKQFPIITKHADSKKLDSKSKEMLERMYLVDQVHNSLLKIQSSPSDAYKKNPILKK